MDNACFFIKNRALFGSYPTQDSVKELEEMGVRYFVDLTFPDEKMITEYVTNYNYIRYSITDRKIPDNWKTFARFLLKIARIIRHLKYTDDPEKHELLYLHCKGGHGRSGIVVACLLCYMGNYTPEKALELTNHCHSKRKTMREVWRTMGSPQSRMQKNFVCNFFEPLYFFRAYKSGYTMGMSNFSAHSVTTELGTFPTSEAAFQAYKDPENAEYIIQQQESRTPMYSKQIGMKCNLREDWHDIRDDLMYKVIKLKFQQHDDIRENLLKTGFRPIIERPTGERSSAHVFNKRNKLGEILMQIRKEFLKSSNFGAD